MEYLRDPAAIYAQSFATIREEIRLDSVPASLHDVAIRMVHASGMIDLIDDFAAHAELVPAAQNALRQGAPVFCDCEMVRSGITSKAIPAGGEVIVTLNDARIPVRAAQLGTTRSAAAVEFWADRLAGAVIVIGNAPTALFHLLEMLDAGAPLPAAIIATPVGFVGAVESKVALTENSRGVPFVTIKGRRGGSAMASAAFNAIGLGMAQ